MRIRRAMQPMLRPLAPIKNRTSAPTTGQMEESTSRKFASREAFVWVYIAALAALAGLAWLLVTRDDAPHAEPHLPWWAVALGFACAEVCVVHVRFRRSAHSFSLADVPFVFGLVFASGDAFVLGAIIGTGIVWGLVRRLQLVKVCFNLAQLALAASIAAGMLELVAGSADALQPETWVGLY